MSVRPASMDLTYGRAVAFAAPVFLLFVALEAIINRARGTHYCNLADALTSVGCGTAFIGARVTFGFTGLIAYDFVVKQWAPMTLPVTHWVTWVFAFLLYDLCYYWWHRLSHTVAFLWGAHVVHHQSEEFNLTTALRQPATAFLSGWMFYLPLAFCGVPISVYLAVGVAQLFYQFWPHTRHIGRLGFLDRWVQTPSNHRVHHARNLEYVNKNYVGIFLIWDRLVGTFEEERDDPPCEYGISEPVSAWNPVWANLHFYWRLAIVSWRTRSWLDKFRVWFAAPGWLPADVRSSPAAPVQSRFSSRRFAGAAIYALVQFAAAIMANQHFLSVFSEQTLTANVLYFGFILITLFTVSAVIEGRSEFFPLEAARLAAVAGAVTITGQWFGFEQTGAIAAFAIASLLWFAITWSGLTSRLVQVEQH
ncbi:MAG TPA: sterol desaturase family protein [Bryobacteraceae bacterium]|nr:sterol desaturase family protein [Bryobacteraceae bacterium]